MSKKLFVFFLFFLALRLLLFNINISEWGDSYSIIRAAESLRSSFSYPVDEKRLPLFSVLIALNPLPVEMMIWAKILQILLTAGVLFLTYRLAKRFFPDLSNFALLPAGRQGCTLIFALLFSPVFLYWSIRVVAEVLLTFLVLLAFELYYSNSRWRLPLLGLVCGLAALARYEGFLLAGAFGLSFILSKKIKPIILYSSFFTLTISPWLIRNYLTFGNPFFSSYFSEPSTYTYNLNTVFIFIASLVFLLGFPSAFLFVVSGGRRLFSSVRSDSRHWSLLTFIFLELLLILFWPAAVPRLFLPLIPIFTVFIVGDIGSVAASHGSPPSQAPHASQLHLFLVTAALTALYVLSQYFLRLHFLVLSKSGLAFIAGLGILSAVSWLIFGFEKARKIFLGLFLTSQIISSFVIINNHRLIYSDALYAAQFAASSEGLVGYSDETGVVEYYLGEKGRKLPDDFFEAKQQWNWLQENKIDYLLATDEYEQLSRFNVFESADYADRFRLVRSWKVESADAFDSFLMRRGLFSQRDYPSKQAAVYEVL